MEKVGTLGKDNPLLRGTHWKKQNWSGGPVVDPKGMLADRQIGRVVVYQGNPLN